MIKKFRVWSEDYEEYLRDDEYRILSDGSILYTKSSSFIMNDEENILEQFTGLLDKNGREIYEGDVVCSTQDHEAYLMSSIFSTSEWTNYSNGIIKWIIDGWHICEKNIGSTRLGAYSTCDCHGAALIVIGNVHENNA